MIRKSRKRGFSLLAEAYKRQTVQIQQLEEALQRHAQYWRAVGEPIKRRKLDTDYFTARGRLASMIADLFTLDELRAIAFNLGDMWVELGGDGLHAKAMAMIEYFQHRHQIYKLIDELQEHRPGIEWPMI